VVVEEEIGSHRLYRRLVYDARLQLKIEKKVPVRGDRGLCDCSTQIHRS